MIFQLVSFASVCTQTSMYDSVLSRVADRFQGHAKHVVETCL